MRMSPSSPVALVLLSLVTLGLLIGAVAAGWDNVRYWGAPTTEGTVVEHEHFVFDDGDDGWKIIVEWTDEHGDTVRTPSKFASSHPHEIGSTVEVQYIPGNQGMVRIVTWADKWLASTILGGISLIFGLVLTYGLWRRREFRRSREAVL